MLVLVVLVLIVSAVYLFFLKVNFYWKNRGIPHEQPILFYGNSKGLSKDIHFADLTKRLYDKFKDEAPLCGMYLFIRPVALITDLDLIKNILIKDFNSFSDRGIYFNERDDPLSAHLFSVDGPQWRYMRAKLSPTFTSGKMKFMFPTILDVGEELESILQKTVESEPIVEMKDILARFTTDVIGSCAFGIECNSLKDPNAELRVRGRELFKSHHNPVVSSFMQTFPKLAKFLRLKVLRDDISKFFMNIVQETVKYREENGVHRKDFLDLLLDLKNSDKEGNGLSLGQIAAQVFIFFIGGFDTSSATMGYCLYELALHQDIQDKVRAEIKEVLAKHNGKFIYESTIEMTYMDQVINETLRKYPPLPILLRKAIKDYPIEGTKFIIEKDTSIFIPNYAIQQDPEIFSNPEKFDPERFSPEGSKNRHPCAFLPFGDGPRNCIGVRFGRMQTRVGLVMLLRSFKFSVCDSTPIPMKHLNESFVLAPRSGINLRVEML